MPEVSVKMSVYDYADLLNAYAPVGVSVWYSPASGELSAGLRDTADKDVTLPRNGVMCLDNDLDVLFGLADKREEETDGR
jgi:hypothetical protein